MPGRGVSADGKWSCQKMGQYQVNLFLQNILSGEIQEQLDINS